MYIYLYKNPFCGQMNSKCTGVYVHLYVQISIFGPNVHANEQYVCTYACTNGTLELITL